MLLTAIWAAQSLNLEYEAITSIHIRRIYNLHHLATVRTSISTSFAENNQNERQQNAQRCEDKCYDHSLCIIITLGYRQLLAREQLVDSRNALDHTLRVVSLAEVGNHILLLQTIAHRIGKYPLKAVARNEAHLAQTLDKKNTETIIELIVTHTPALEEAYGKLEAIGRLYLLKSHHSHLGYTSLLKAVAHRIDSCDSIGRENPIGIDHKARTIHTLYVRHILHTICCCLKRLTQHQQRHCAK